MRKRQRKKNLQTELRGMQKAWDDEFRRDMGMWKALSICRTSEELRTVLFKWNRERRADG